MPRKKFEIAKDAQRMPYLIAWFGRPMSTADIRCAMNSVGNPVSWMVVRTTLREAEKRGLVVLDPKTLCWDVPKQVSVSIGKTNSNVTYGSNGISHHYPLATHAE